MAHDVSDETVMAYADGEASPEAARRIEAAMAKDAALARRVEMFRATRRMARDAMSGVEEEPVPAALRAAVERQLAAAREESVVVPLRPPRRAPLPRYQLPMAASIVAVVAGLAGYVLGLSAGNSPDGGSMIALDSRNWNDVVATLDGGASGSSVEVPGARIEMIASFGDSDGRFCREFELDRVGQSTVVSVACRSGQEWEVNFAVAAPPADGGYAPAASRGALGAYLEAIGAGQPMSVEEERRHLDAARQ